MTRRALLATAAAPLAPLLQRVPAVPHSLVAHVKYDNIAHLWSVWHPFGDKMYRGTAYMAEMIPTLLRNNYVYLRARTVTAGGATGFHWTQVGALELPALLRSGHSVGVIAKRAGSMPARMPDSAFWGP